MALTVIASVAVAAAVTMSVMTTTAGSGSATVVPPGGRAPHGVVVFTDTAGDIPPPVPVTDAELGALPQATTFGTVPDAPRDEANTAPSGRLVHPVGTVAVYLAPGDRAIAALPPTQLVSDTWLPVIDEQPGWARVLLPVRPGHSTGWIFLDDPKITVARTPYRLMVDRAHFTLTLFKQDNQVGRWTVGIGKPDALTPAGRTFLLASIRETTATYSPVVLPLGTHSDTYTSYGGGPGTVGIHTWPTDDVYGRQSSDGCVRVPAHALEVLSTEVPLGTPVLIS